MEVRDPVCGMTFEDVRTAATLFHDGTRYYFCTVTCRNEFAEDPGRFLPPEATGDDPVPEQPGR